MSLSTQELQRQIDALKAEKKVLMAETRKEIRIQVSQKGAVSFYGLGRFPVTLYGEQWMRLLAETDRIKAFIADNASSLATKANKSA